MYTQMPAGFETVDKSIKKFLDTFVDSVSALLKDDLVGIYLHGSLAMGSYYLPKSDIDLIIVVKSSLSADFRKKLANHFAHIADERPTIGNIEVSVLIRFAASHFTHPCPFELHYSTDWHEKILHDEVDFSNTATDVDLAAHLTYVLKRGINLKGEAIEKVFGAVPWSYFMDSILDDFNWIVDDEHILESPFYAVLNICRVLQTVSAKNELVYSKDEGGEWALQNLPSEFHTVVQKALDIYRSPQNIEANQRRTGGVHWDSKQLLDFRDFSRQKLTEMKSESK